MQFVMLLWSESVSKRFVGLNMGRLTSKSTADLPEISLGGREGRLTPVPQSEK